MPNGALLNHLTWKDQINYERHETRENGLSFDLFRAFRVFRSGSNFFSQAESLDSLAQRQIRATRFARFCTCVKRWSALG